MPDQPQSTPPGEWNELEPFRRTFTQHITQPEILSALETLGRLMFDATLEASRYWPAGEPLPRRELRAAAEDLAYIAAYLRKHVGRQWRVSVLAPADVLLSQLAERLSGEVAGIGARITAALD